MKTVFALIENGTALAKIDFDGKDYSNARVLRGGNWVSMPPADFLFDGLQITSEEADAWQKK
jgi:hypothetical protein